jgi:plasmid stabilization system protein ParE
MPRGDKSSYTDKQKRMAEHIEDSYESKGVSENEAERRAWATVNKETGGGKRSGSGRKGGSTRGGSEHERRSAAAKKGWETRRKK